MSPTPDPEFTGGADTLVGVLRSAAEEGYAASFRLDPGAVLGCPECGTETAPSELPVDHYRRLEGASDAADLMLVVLARCPACDARGTLTLGYGPNAGDHDEAFLEALDLRDVPTGPDPQA